MSDNINIIDLKNYDGSIILKAQIFTERYAELHELNSNEAFIIFKAMVILFEYDFGIEGKYIKSIKPENNFLEITVLTLASITIYKVYFNENRVERG